MYMPKNVVRYLALIAGGWLIAFVSALLLAEVLRPFGYAKVGSTLGLACLIFGTMDFWLSWGMEATRLDGIAAEEGRKRREELDRIWQEINQKYEEHIRIAQEAEAKRKAQQEALQAESRAIAERKARELVYFIVDRQESIVKIGVSMSPENRLRSLRTSNPRLLELAATLPGGYDLERQLHERYAKHRIKGEWFQLTPGILRQIESSKAQVRRAQKMA
jgi:hypothetical protein